MSRLQVRVLPGAPKHTKEYIMELIGILIGAGLMAWLNHYLAGQRGRNQMGWAIGGAFFGIFATILILILGMTEEKRISIQAEALKRV
jgi:hypothetical protein